MIESIVIVIVKGIVHDFLGCFVGGAGDIGFEKGVVEVEVWVVGVKEIWLTDSCVCG